MNVIMYHYVRNKSKIFPNFKAIDQKTFISQIEYFQNVSKIGSSEELIKNVINRHVNRNYYLTFDDGFKEHYDFVANFLDEKNIKAFFFPSTLPIQDSKVLPVHKVHMLIGKYNSDILLEQTLKDIDPNILDNKKIDEFDKEIYKDQNNTPSQKKIKRLFNYYIKYEHREEILNRMFCKYFCEKEVFDQLYMTKNNIRELYENGHVIGSHTHSHKVLSRLNKIEQEDEIEKSEQILKSLLGDRWSDNLTFCYPYGGSKSFNRETIEILRKRKYSVSFMVDNVKVNKNNIKYPYKIKRIDCNRFLNV